ncbi:MAG TPA: N-methyl-D-aspartate receptor NMDAR2C subunit [Thermoanaerobaculia bacterium]
MTRSPAESPLLLEARWRSAWDGLELSPPAVVYPEILRAHREAHRAYHTLEHLAECFAHLEAVRQHAERLPEIQIALWFHDSFYDTWRSDNEERSAAWARSVLLDAGAPGDASAVAGRISDLILATRRHAAATSMDMALMIDIDLAILGANPPRFADYEQQIREEYHWVPNFLFRRKRRQFLASLLARPRIYHTDFFRARLEAAARRNLQTSLENLDRPLAEE